MFPYNKKSFYTPIIISLLLIAGIFIGYKFAINNSRNVVIYPEKNKLSNILELIQQEYVDSISEKNISEAAIHAMLKELDPHSVYIPAEELQEVNEPLEGGFSGIGVQFNIQDDTVAIINTIPNGPSERIGIKAGDRIITVNDSLIAGKKINSNDVVKLLKGPRGTTVRVGIKRAGKNELLKFEITRDNIPLYSVDISYMLNEKTGYIKINQFARTTVEEFISGVSTLRSKGMKNLIIDVRGNSGGYLDAAIKLADQFLTNNKLIVYTQGRNRGKESFDATAAGICHDQEVAILIDESSASASEILAGAIQDHDRGWIIGRRSFGKGLVQDQIPLPDGSAVRLTIARYYTPSGRSIQKPYDKGIDNYYQELYERYNHKEFETADSIKQNDSLVYKTMGGRIVYGGGGIMPDLFVPIDTTGFSEYYRNVRDNGIINNFAFFYADKNRIKLEKLKTANEINKYLESDTKLLNDFYLFAEKKGIRKIDSDIKISEHLLNIQLKAYIARNIIDNDGFYPIIREIDETLNIAIETLENKKLIIPSK